MCRKNAFNQSYSCCFLRARLGDIRNWCFVVTIGLSKYSGEEYQLFWPEQSEFVRMAARFGAKIVPFGVVGEDDVSEVCDVLNISYSSYYIGRCKNGVNYFMFVVFQSQLLLDYDDLMKIPFSKTRYRN